MADRDPGPMLQAALTTPQKLEAKTARVGVIGLGYVGLPLALLFSRKGFPTTGFDVDPAKIELLRRGETYIRHVPRELISEEVRAKRLRSTANFDELGEMDAIIICVPTPLDEHREPDLSFIRKTTEVIRANLRPGHLVVLESTTYPGTTEELVLPLLEESGLRCPPSRYRPQDLRAESLAADDSGFYLAFSPEREDPGNRDFKTPQIPKVIGGINGPSALLAQMLYRNVFEQTLIVSSAQAAEMTKLLENIYRCVNIALVNELKLLCLRMGIDIWEVIEAAKTKPFGFSAFYPGPGLGGHCIPIDPFYLTWKAREYDFPTRFIELAGEINATMPDHVVTMIAEALNSRGQCLRDARILIIGVAYKKDVDDLRESPALRIMQLLQDRKAHVEYHDPFIPRLPRTRRYDFGLESVSLTPECLSNFAAVVIATDHSCLDIPLIVRHAPLVIDTRNATRGLEKFQDKIVRC